MSTQPKVFLISGANRGVGLALTQNLLASTDAIIFAGARDVSKATDLGALFTQYPGRLHIVKLASASVEDANAVVEEIETKVGRIDTVIANAGIAYFSGSVATTPLEDIEEQWRVNALGPVVLYQAVHDLLLRSSAPQFAWISSLSGQISTLDLYGVMPNGPYGSSKAAANFFSRKIAFEEPTLVSIAIHPGIVSSGMGLVGMKKLGFTKEAVKGMGMEILSTQESAQKIVSIIKKATLESKMSGTFVDENGRQVAY